METPQTGYQVKTYNVPVKRYCQTLDLRDSPELIAEYRKRHSQAEVWPEILAGIHEVVDNKYIYLQGNIDKLNQSIDFKYSKTKFLNDIDTLNKNFSKIKQTTIMMNLCNICLLKLGLDIVLYIKSKHKKNDLDVEILSTFEKLFNINLEDFQDIQRLYNSVNK